MSQLLEEITQISICLEDEKERINEIALFHPLSRETKFDETSKPIHQRKWSYTYNLPFLRRLSLKVQSFIFRKAPSLIPKERLTNEARFKTVLALLLAQESLREFFFSNEKRRTNFFQATKEAATTMGYTDFSIPTGRTPFKISQKMTLISGKSVSLIDDLTELNLQMAAIGHRERNEILFQILNQVERPPITSILEVMYGDQTKEIALTTSYAKYKITDIAFDSGKISYHYEADHATSSIQTQENSRPGVKGVMNQRCALDTQSGEWIGSYSGELSLKNHLLEQLLFILDLRGETVFLLDEGEATEEKTVLLTSLFSWHEIGFITDQQAAIRSLNKKILKIGKERSIRLNLLYFNISFNAFNNYPSPSEMGAKIQDINDQALIALIWRLCHHLDLDSEKLTQLKQTLDDAAKISDFLMHQKEVLKAIDQFQMIKTALISQLEKSSKEPAVLSAIALLKGKKTDGKKLRGMDLLLTLNTLAKELGIIHNKNCQNSTDRSAGANAADKAQYAYWKIYQKTFLPSFAVEQEISLFKVLYSMYLVWEEPEINAALSTGFVGEKFHQNIFQKNPETTRYLIQWLKKHPEIYLGLSNQRS